MSPRLPAGVKRIGMRSYQCGEYIIIRDRPWRWLVRHKRFTVMVLDFMAIKFKRLAAAAAWAKNVSRETGDPNGAEHVQRGDAAADRA